MKKSQLRKIIKEEITKVLKENDDGVKNEDASLEAPQWNDPTKLKQLGKVLRGMIDSGEITFETEPEELDNWYWPIADEAIEILKKDHPMVKLSRVPRPTSSETYIEITVSGLKGISPRAEKRFKVYFDENNKVTNIEND